MPKSQYVDPAAKRAPGKITFTDIKVNEYQKTVKDELGNYTRDEFIGIYHDMLLIREFESMINSIKIEGAYNGVPYNHPGPGAPVDGPGGQRGRSGVQPGRGRLHIRFAPQPRRDTRQGHERDTQAGRRQAYGRDERGVGQGGAGRGVRRGQSSVKELAQDFLLYGAMAEIFARKNGFNMGLGGSMHTFYIPFGIYPNNAIVGVGSADIATGAALFKRVNRKGGIVVANIRRRLAGLRPGVERR